jgi:hypothetical protein
MAITDFPFRIGPINNITPFTYRDGVTYLEILYKLRDYINDTLRPEFDGEMERIIEEFNAGIENAEATITTAKNGWQAAFDALELAVNADIAAFESETNATVAANLASIQAAHDTFVDDITALVELINNKSGPIDIQRATLTNNTYQVAVDPLWPTNQPVSFALTQDATGGRTVVLAGNITGTLDLDPKANSVTEFTLIPNGNGTWRIQHFASNLSVKARAHLIVGTASAANDKTLLQTAAENAAAAGAPLITRGNFQLAGEVKPLTEIHIDAKHSIFTQLDSLKATFNLPAKSSLTGGKIIGKGTDWVNTSAVYAASGIAISGNDVVIRDVRVENMAGAGVYVPVANTGLQVIDCFFDGMGSPTIPASTGQYSGGIVFGADNVSDFIVRGGRFRKFAQGIVTGSVNNFFIGGGLELSATGQHGLYLSAVNGGTVSGVRINGSALQAVKAQIYNSAAVDSHLFTIGDVVIRDNSSHGILLTNVDVPPVSYTRRAVIHDVMIEHAAGSSGDGVALLGVSNVSVHDVIAMGGRRGLRATDSNNLDVHHNDFSNYQTSGMNLSSVTDSNFSYNSFRNGSTTNEAAEEFGVLVGGVSNNLRFSHNRITDSASNTKYAFYIAAGDIATMSFAHNIASGLSDYGYRASAATATKMWVGNELSGALGEFFNTPTNATAIADTSGAALATLETEVNKLKARMREIGIVN